MLKRLVIVGSVLVLCGCVSSRTRNMRCAPIDPELYADYGGLYDECTVERRARLTYQPRLEYPYQPPRNVYCLIGELRFIIDTLGRPIQQTVEVTQANDERYIEIMVGALPQVRFAPGYVKDHPVFQVVRWQSRTNVLQQSTTLRRNPSASNSSC